MIIGFKVTLSIIIILCIIALIVPITLWISYSASLSFDVPQTINELWKFFGDIVIVMFGFFLVNMFWKRKIEVDYSNSFRRIFVNKLITIQKISSNILEVIDKKISDDEETLQRDQNISNNATRMSDIAETIETLFDEITQIKEEVILSELTAFLSDIVPNINNLLSSVNTNSSNSLIRHYAETIFDEVSNMISRLNSNERLTI